DTPELLDVRRFRHEWERDASLKLRSGRPSVADEYVRQGRVIGGDRDSVLDALYAAWQADITAGRSSLMIAGDAQTVTDLNTRARSDRVRTGEVTQDGVTLADGTTIGTGDLVATRLNQRDLVTGSDGSAGMGEWVKNGDRWVVTHVTGDGSLRVRSATGTRAVMLPAAYVTEHVELGYATTAHRAQGRTVDTAHAYVTATTTREPLYVMATRGRESNMLYVDTAWDPDHDTAHEDIDPLDPAEVLRGVLARTGADTSATATRAAEEAAAEAPARAAAEGAAILDARREARYLALLKGAGVADDDIEHAKNTDSLRPLIARMHHAERLGLDLQALAIPTRAPGQAADAPGDLHAYEGRLVAQMSQLAALDRSWLEHGRDVERAVDRTIRR
ncbi:hypothetical protein N864_17170, partial [Intrasporangium chromatireducens Q5-1]